jgi:cleavage and polyadenylation specificity factor subunit 3
MMLEEHWASKEEELAHVKVYYTCALIQKCKQVYRSYISMLSKSIQNRFYKQEADPFQFRFVHWLESNSLFNKETVGPMVAMCSPGMLQSGQSRILLEKWCHSPLNGLILTGYCVEGSMADNLRKGNLIRNKDGQEIEVKMDVEVISFSAHADCKQTTEFIKALEPEYVVLVHGSEKNAKALLKHLKK